MLPSGREATINAILEADRHDWASKHGLNQQSLIADPFSPLFHAFSFHRNSTGQDSMEFHTAPLKWPKKWPMSLGLLGSNPGLTFKVSYKNRLADISRKQVCMGNNETGRLWIHNGCLVLKKLSK